MNKLGESFNIVSNITIDSIANKLFVLTMNYLNVKKLLEFKYKLYKMIIDSFNKNVLNTNLMTQR